jgi:hypothetical protein
MKQPILASIILILAVQLFSSCKKEVRLDINSTEERIVIEADISPSKTVNYVIISKTVNLYENNTFPGVRGAVVTISDNMGYYVVLDEEKRGYYRVISFPGISGRKYYLTVKYDNQEYQGVCTMPTLVNLDTVVVSKFNFGQNEATGFLPLYQDPIGIKNYYRFLKYHNGKRIKGTAFLSDDFSDGRINREPLFDSETQFKKGDTVKIDMQCISMEVYYYFYSRAQTATQQSSAPANPVSNISGGALGFFSVHTIQSKTLVIN